MKDCLLPILTNSLIHFSLEGRANVLFDLGSEREEMKMTEMKMKKEQEVVEREESDQEKIEQKHFPGHLY